MTKSWFITGATSGLGRILAQKLLERGDRVVGTGRREDALADLRSRYGERFEAITLDITDIPAVRSAVHRAFEALGRIDVVVSNAGYGLFGAAEELSDEQIERQIATNLTGSIQLIRACLPHLRRQGGGRIVQVSSEGGQITYPNFSLYHATKWGIEGFVETVAQEVAPFGIDVLIVEPGPTGTGFGAGLDHAAPMPAYDATPAGDVRRALADGRFELRGDADRTVDAMIVATEAARPPLRLPLGSSAFANLTRAYEARLAEVTAQREVAFSADRQESSGEASGNEAR